METKQTAVDWIFLMLNDPNRDQNFAKKLYDKAKEIEKEQIINAYKESADYFYNCSKKGKSEEYYNETYGK